MSLCSLWPWRTWSATWALSPSFCDTNDEALDTIAAANISLAILDLNLRGKSSEPVALSLRKRSIPFLVCSGTALGRMTGALDGVVHLDKPYADRDLQTQILAALSQIRGGR